MLWERTENKEEVKLAGTGTQGYGGYGQFILSQEQNRNGLGMGR